MLACQYGHKTGTEKCVAAIDQARPIAGAAVAHEEKSPGRRYRRHTRKTAHVLRDERVFASGPRMRPQQLIAKLKESTRGWRFDMASIGFPRARAQGTHRKRSETFGQRVGWFQFCQSPRRTDAP